MTTGTSIAATSTITSRTVRDALVQGHVSTVRRWLRAGQVCARTWRDRQQGGMDAHDNVRMNRSGDDDASREDTTGWPLLFFAVRYGYDALLLELLEMERREDHDEHDVQASAALSSKECPSQATRQAQHEQPQPRRSSPFAFLDRRNATLLQQQQQQLPLTPRTSPPPLPSAHLTPALPSAAASSSPTMHHAGPAMNFPFHHARVVLSPPTPTHSRVPSGDTSPEPSSTTLPAVSPSPPTTIIQDARGRTALMLAVLYDNLKAVDWLLMFHRAEIDVREEERGETALHMAARKGHDDVMEVVFSVCVCACVCVVVA